MIMPSACTVVTKWPLQKQSKLARYGLEPSHGQTPQSIPGRHHQPSPSSVPPPPPGRSSSFKCCISPLSTTTSFMTVSFRISILFRMI